MLKNDISTAKRFGQRFKNWNPRGSLDKKINFSFKSAHDFDWPSELYIFK
jgi:hypothetical protein